MKPTASSGFTLIEILIVIVVLAIILALGVPSFVDTLDKRRLTNATKSLTSQIQQARTFSILLNRPVVVVFEVASPTNWCLGVTDNSTCSCSTASSCTIARPDNLADRIEVVSRSTEYPNVALGVANGALMRFEPTRGIREDALGSPVVWTVSSTRTTRQASVNVNAIGRATACASSGGALFGGLRQC